MNESLPAELLYRSSRYRATRFAVGGRRLVVVFDYWRGDRNGFPDSRRWEAISAIGYDQIVIACTANDWFISDDTANLRAFLEGIASRYAEVVLFGSSMGAFAAMLFSGVADRICLVSPMYSIDRRICAFETRWPSEAAALPDVVDVARHGKRHAAGVLIYDPRHALDARHAGLIHVAFPDLKRFGLPFSGHPATGTVRASGQHARFDEAMFSGALTQALARDLHRRGRTRSPIYLTEVAVRIKGRDPRTARRLLASALDHAGEIASVNQRAALVFRIASNLVDVGDYSKIHHMRWALDNRKTPPAWWRRRIRESCELRDRSAVVRIRDIPAGSPD